MTDPEYLLEKLEKAKATALERYIASPEDENHLRYQRLDELVTFFHEMRTAAPKVETLKGGVLIPLTLLEGWLHSIARNVLYQDDNSYIQVEAAIKDATKSILTPEEVYEARTGNGTIRLYIDDLATDQVQAFLTEPSRDTIERLNNWLKAVGKAVVWEGFQHSNARLL
jgi:hypothetical protein